MLATRKFISWTQSGHFWAPCNCMRTFLPSQAVDKVNFMDLDCACITLHEFISCQGPCRGHTGRFLSLVFSFNSITRVLRPVLTLCSAPTWWIGGVHRTTWFLYFFVFLHPASGKFPQQFLSAHRSQRYLWFPGLRNRTLGWLVLFATPSREKIPLDQGSCHHVSPEQSQKEGTYQSTTESCQSGRLTIVSLYCKAFTTSFSGISSGVESPSAGRSE